MFFLWRYTHDVLATKSNLARRGFSYNFHDSEANRSSLEHLES
ncbi:hypothetical protein LINPERHAP2_LOCUS6064 [Linum perenne]